jgi:D-glycero-alpha-D-manno-heptose 1-phosphate guanylyltransferase
MKAVQNIELQVPPLASGGGMGYEAIILAGGLGTRLRSVVNDVPKCMAPVNGIPFINFIVSYLKNEDVTKFIFSLGYKHELITAYLDKTFPELVKHYSIETEPLGTGGAIKKACEFVSAENVLALNGDTLFNIDLPGFLKEHTEKKTECTVALKEMKNFSRYGAVELNKENLITAFHEKRYCEQGLINGGIYAIQTKLFLNKNLPAIFSFEKDYLEKFFPDNKIAGIKKDYYFIDIGIPEDYQKFQNDCQIILSKYKYEKNNLSLTDFFLEGLPDLIN